MLLVSCAVKT
jgi:amino acid permease